MTQLLGQDNFGESRPPGFGMIGAVADPELS